MFGGQQPSLFGAPTSQPSAFGGFGTTTTFGATPGGGGLFGQSQPAQPTFGGTSAFGATAFGQPQQQPQQSNPFSTTGSTGFGTTSNLFGGQQTTQPAQSTGLFGNTGLFGAPSQPTAQTAFGQPQQQPSTGLFGASSTSGSLFGQPKSGFGTGSTFGAPQTGTPSLFGGAQQSSQSGGLFGNSGATTTGTGLFGQQSTSNLFGGMGPSQSGTTVKFVPVLGSDAAIKNGQQSTVTTKNYCICTMKEYNEQKSQEELRLEDYLAGRKTGTATNTTSSGMFGSQTQPAGTTGTGGLFGSSTASPFAATSAFGQQSAAAKPGGIFGTTSGSMFGQSAPATNFFGGQTATATTGLGQSGSLFAQPAASATQSSFGGFAGLGSAPPATTASAFGANAFGTTTSFGGFGQNAAPAATNMFGQPAPSTAAAAPFGSFGGTSSLFAAKPATAPAGQFGGFGTAAPLTGFGGFPSAGTTQPATNTGSLFGGPAKPLFGASTTSATPFGALGGATGFGGFGATTATQPTTGMFGQPATASTGLFGTSSQSLGSSFFGATQPAQLMPSAQSAAGGNIHAQVVEMLRQGVSDTEVLSNMYAQLPAKPVEKKSAPLSGATINAFINNAKNSYAPAVGSSRKDERTYNYYVAPTHKVDGLTLSSAIGPISWRPAAAKRDERFKLDRACIEQVESEMNKSRMDTPRPVGKLSQIKSSIYPSSDRKHSGKGDRVRSSNKITPPVQVFNVRKAFDQMQDDSVTGTGSQHQDEASDDESADEQSLASGDDEQENLRGGQAAVILRRPDYYTIPDMSELVLDGKGQCIVDDFYIGRYQCGGVQFLGSTNVAGLNLDALITISENEVVVYPDERKKPPVGKGLNKKAIITFENVRPQSTDDRPLSRDEIVESGFEEMLRARIASTMEDAEFLAYKADTGQVSFIVKHFSKYKLFLTKDDVIVHPGKRQKTVEAPPAWSTDLLEFNSEAGEDADLGFENFSKGSEDSSKENLSPLVPRKRRHVEEEDQGEEQRTINQSLIYAAEKSGDFFSYFDRVLPDGTEEVVAVPSALQPTLSTAPQTRRVMLEYGIGAKPITGALTFGNPVGVLEFLASVEGQFLSPCSLQNDVLLTEDSKEYLEEMLQLYLSNCDYEMEKGESVISPPVAASSPKFVEDFCQLAEHLPGSGDSAVNEKILWSLFRTLYGQADVPEAQLCEKLLEWLKATVALLQPSYSTLEEIAPQNATQAIFQAVLAGRNDEAVDVALHFGLFDVAMTILALEKANNDQPQVWAVVDTYLDHVIATVDEHSDSSINYLTKTLMLLGNILRLRECANLHTGSFSVCQGLDWLQCLAACALHLPNQITSGMWDILREYKEHASRDPHCALPEQTGGLPGLIFSMLSHYCRHSLPNVTSSLDIDLLNDKSFDIRTKWFLVRMYGVVGDGFTESTELTITSDFVKILQVYGYPHVAIVALLHLRPVNKARQNEIRNLLLTLVPMAQEKPDVCHSLVAFLLNDLGVAPEDIENVKATLALRRTDKLTALGHFLKAGNVTSCRDIITNHVLPLLASADSTTFSEILEKCDFLSMAAAGLAHFGAFFQLLFVLEECKAEDRVSPRSRATLDRLMDRLSDGTDLLPRTRTLLDGFVRHKLRHARALLLSADKT